MHKAFGQNDVRRVLDDHCWANAVPMCTILEWKPFAAWRIRGHAIADAHTAEDYVRSSLQPPQSHMFQRALAVLRHRMYGSGQDISRLALTWTVMAGLVCGEEIV